MPLQSTLHLAFNAIVGRYKVWANQEQEKIGCFQLVADLIVQNVARQNFAVIPHFNPIFSLEIREMDMQTIKRTRIVVRI